MVKHVYFDLVTQFRSSCTRRFVSITRTFPFSFLIASLTALLLSMHTAFWPHSLNGFILICRWQVTINWLNKFLLLLQSMYFSTKWRHRSIHVWIYKGFRVFLAFITFGVRKQETCNILHVPIYYATRKVSRFYFWWEKLYISDL